LYACNHIILALLFSTFIGLAERARDRPTTPAAEKTTDDAKKKGEDEIDLLKTKPRHQEIHWSVDCLPV
jgi:hypothetical protein